MTYKELTKRIKEEQKTLAHKIRNGKSGLKPCNRRSDNMNDLNSLEGNQSTYRHNHIVYCMLFNRTPYEQIEQPRDNNLPSSYYLEKIQKEWESELDEALRDCA